MLLKMTIIMSLILLSSTESQDKQSSKYAVSSQSFHRDDVPLSYKYSAVHVYPTVKPGHLTQAMVENQKKKYYTIQYAALRPSNTAEINRESKKISEHIYKLKYLGNRKENLERKNKQFIPGHNIEVLQTVNQNPGHNAVYRDSDLNFHYKKANYLQHYVVNQKPSPSETFKDNKGLTKDWISTTEAPANIYDLTEQSLRGNFLKEKDVSEIEDTKIPHPLPHRVHLNIARQYGMSQIIPVASDHILDSSKMDKHTWSQIFKYLPQFNKNHYLA